MFEGFYILWFVGQLLFGFIGGWMLAIWRMGEESTLSFCIDTVKEQPVTSLVLLIFLPILTIETIFLNVFIDVVIVLFVIIAFVLHSADEIVCSKFKRR